MPRCSAHGEDVHIACVFVSEVCAQHTPVSQRGEDFQALVPACLSQVMNNLGVNGAGDPPYWTCPGASK